ncbi:MAG: PASTA domain-containing protein [Thermoanaerobaculales bacterium]|nr:PASTA domain-containing protein [Thermoanaerobaculales bacterium]
MSPCRNTVISASILIFLTALHVGVAAAQGPGSDDDQAELIRQLKTISIDDPPPADPLARSAHAMRRYLEGDCSEPELYREVKAAYPDLELRDAIVQTKTRIIQLIGTDEASFFLGEIYQRGGDAAGAPRGSALEDRLLEWRSRLAERVKVQSAAELKGRNVVNGERHSVFFADVGSQPSGPGEKALSGDIDVNILSSNRELAMAMLEAAEAKIRAETGGFSGTEIDVVFTVMGMSGPEVYAAEAGRAVALRLIAEGRCGNVRRIDLDAGVVAEEWTGPDALREIGVEAGLRAAAEQPIEGMKLPDSGPAAVLEMARHLDRDVLRHMQFEDFDTLFKIAKFVERADLVAGQRGYDVDSELVRFAKDLLEVKASKDWPRATQVVRDYFGELPVEVRLGRTPEGKTSATLTANRKLLEGFGSRCRDDLLDFGKRYLREEIADLKGRVRLAQDGFEDPKALADDMARLMYDMEVENLILQDGTEGLRTMDPELLKLTEELHGVNKQLLGSRWEDILPDDLKQQLEWVRKLLEQGGETNKQLAAAGLFTTSGDLLARGLEGINGVNAVLDSLDDNLLGPLRGDTEWRGTLLAARQAAISERSLQTFGRRLLPESAQSYVNRAEVQVQRAENYLNPLFYDNFLAKRVQQANRVFRESVQSSSVGSAAMTGLQVIRLKDEMSSYWRALDEGGWEELATEFFRRRVPGGSAAEHVVMGNYGLATWDLFATVVPPASLAQMTFGLGEELGADAWDFYWSTMLEELAKELYDSATWQVRRTDRFGDIELGSWELVAVTYRDQEIRIRDYIETKRTQVEEMRRAAQLRPAGEQIRFPYEYASSDPLTGWLAADDILRENLAHADNMLLVLDEAKKHPAAGWRRRDHIHKVWTTRWEQVKLAWVQELFDTLERRKRAAEFGPERFTEALNQLHEITDELKITEQVDESLADEGVPPTVMSYLRWLTDATPDAVADFYELPAAEDEWIEATRIVLDALETYDTVFAARHDAESDFVDAGRPAEDSGLRILTTPFILAGQPSVDARDYERWRGLPMEVATSVHDELDAIKRELSSGGGLDPDDGSFDQRILGGVIYHDTFKEMWKHVQSTTAEVRGSTSNLDFEVWWELWKESKVGDDEAGHAFLDGARDRVTGADRLEGIGSRDLPLERFRVHDTARDDLVLEFVEHYLLGDDRLAELEQRAVALAAEIAGICDDARSEAEAVRVAAESMRALAEDVDATLDTIGPELDEAPVRLAEVAERAAAAEIATTETRNAMLTSEGLSLELCELLPKLRSATTATARRPILEQMEGLGARLDGEVERGESMTEEANVSAEAAASELELATTALDAVDTVTEASADLGDGSEERARLDTARTRLDEARALVDELTVVKNEALEVLERAIRAVEGLREDDRLVELLQSVEARVDRIVAAPDAVAPCPDEGTAVVDAVATELDGAIQVLAAARSRLDGIETATASLRTELTGAEQKVDSAQTLASLAEDYLERLHTAADGADICLDLAHDLTSALDQPTVPDVTGLAAADARAAIERLGLSASLVAGEAAPEPSLAFTVGGQSPAGGEPAGPDGVVTLRVYGESSTVDVPFVVGLPAAAAKARIEDAGLTVALQAGDAASKPDEAFLVQHQSPGSGAAVDRGSTVALRIRGDFDPVAAVQGVDCSAWPGTEPVWDRASSSAQCRCPAATRWDGQSHRCVASAPVHPAAAPPAVDTRCAELAQIFRNLMLAGRVNEAKGILAQATDCDFYNAGLAALQNQRDLECQRLNAMIMAACQQQNAAQAEALMQQAYAQRCAVSAQAYACLQQAQQSEQIRRNQQTAQAWDQLFTTMNDVIRMQQDAANQRHDATTQNLAPNTMDSFADLWSNMPTPSGPYDPLNANGLQAPPSTPPGGGGGSTGAGGSTGGGGRSAADCERQYCPMCFNDVDMLGVSVDPQCMECRRLNGAKISACARGESAGAATQTTATYRVVCALSEPDANGRRRYTFCSCVEPGGSISPGSYVAWTGRSWDECRDKAYDLPRQ